MRLPIRKTTRCEQGVEQRAECSLGFSACETSLAEKTVAGPPCERQEKKLGHEAELASFALLERETGLEPADPMPTTQRAGWLGVEGRCSALLTTHRGDSEREPYRCGWSFATPQQEGRPLPRLPVRRARRHPSQSFPQVGGCLVGVRGAVAVKPETSVLEDYLSVLPLLGRRPMRRPMSAAKFAAVPTTPRWWGMGRIAFDSSGCFSA